MRLGWLLAVGMAMAFGASAVRAAEVASLPDDEVASRVSVVDITLAGLPDGEAANARLAMTLARL